MAHSKLPVPTALNMKGEVTSNWKFKDQRQNYEITSGLAQKEANVKLATLKVVMGKDCLWKEILSQQRIRHFKISQSIYFVYDVGIISSHSKWLRTATRFCRGYRTLKVTRRWRRKQFMTISKCVICNEFQPQQQKEPLISHETPKLPRAEAAVDLFTSCF